MLLNRGEIREDTYFDTLAAAILKRDQPRKPEDHYLGPRGIRAQSDAPARPAIARRCKTARRLGQNAGRTRLLRRFEKDWIYN